MKRPEPKNKSMSMSIIVQILEGHRCSLYSVLPETFTCKNLRGVAACR